MSIYRFYVEKRAGFDVEAKAAKAELAEVLGLCGIDIKVFNRYDIQNVEKSDLDDIISVVLSEPSRDICYNEFLPELGGHLLCIEPLPGRFDARADSCEQCVEMLLGGRRPAVKWARVYWVDGATDAEFALIKAYLLNPLEYQEAKMAKPETLEQPDFAAADVPLLEDYEKIDLAMSQEDLQMVKDYFKSENRAPTLAELRVIDTYWSDHCRHTTFHTIIKSAEINDPRVLAAYNDFLEINGNKPVTLMNIATAAMRSLKPPMMEESDENNACTLRFKADFDHGQEDWLLYFKNETHNHPTEIEPFGGASTCLGGAIRDPLSGRAYVYQAMRISGAGDPRKPIESTLPGKIPQRKLTQTAAEGFSSYGNQIGVATGFVRELYHEGYAAKRLEAGAVVGATPAAWVRKEKPVKGDVVVLLGGRTGRDGIGGATGSSKSHSAATVSESGAQVQKGNAPEERKLQRLFRNPKVTRTIKKCNDFGAGGVAVAVGELAAGVEIDLGAIPTKYQGLNGVELAISESQERMAAVVAAVDAAQLLAHAEEENIEATIIARITDDNRLTMHWRGQRIVDISREFLDTNGAKRYADAHVPPRKDFAHTYADLDLCSQKGLAERFDSTIGAGSVFAPFGGEYALTESQIMAALIPAKGAKTASAMAFGCDPHFTEADPFGGSVYNVVTSVAKLVAAGVCRNTIHLSLQEYFPRLKDDPKRWGLPFAAMLGAFSAQMGLGIAAIGGKDSMWGSFGDLDVPPTLISFAVGLNNVRDFISSEFKKSGSYVYLLEAPMGNYGSLLSQWDKYIRLCRTGNVLSAWAVDVGGVQDGISKMALGNMIGFSGETGCKAPPFGSIIFESPHELENFRMMGRTGGGSVNGKSLQDIRKEWEAPLEGVFPMEAPVTSPAPVIADERRPTFYCKTPTARPKAVIPVFPGTNCEYDTQAALERAGGSGEVLLVRNLTPRMLQDAVFALEKAISTAQMLIFPGGFSGGDEPDGSAKFIVSLFRNPRLKNAVHELINRDGLVLGICNGFQALVKLGLLPFGQIGPMTADCPTLTHNLIGRHQAKYVQTRVASVNSPWLSKCNVGEIHTQPISHGEGRFVANLQILDTLKTNGQIVFQYLDNPNGSVWDIEGICSPCGRILGKMAHTERWGPDIARNVYGNRFLPLFEGGVAYFK